MPENAPPLRKPKTWKRETAGIAGLFWAGITVRLFWSSDPALVAAFAAAYGTVTFCTFTLIGAMFGIHFYGPRTPPGGDSWSGFGSGWRSPSWRRWARSRCITTGWSRTRRG